MIQDVVVAVIPEEQVGDVLPAIHRAGYGHLARMIRTGKRPVLDQLQRAGVPVSQAPTVVADLPAVLLVSAAARSPMAAALLMRHGASRVWTISPAGAWQELEDMVLAQPNVHMLPPHPARATTSTVATPAAPPPLSFEPDGERPA
jgi:hypothetical protein